MSLTNRASEFLRMQERRADAITSMEIINKAFEDKDLIPTKELIDFQMKYGGLMIYAGLEPICFGIIHGNLIRGGEFGSNPKLINQIIHYLPDTDINANCFVCADTLYQELFMIDENGKYYEGWKLKATHFDHVIEDLAIYDEIYNSNFSQVVGEYFEDVNLDLKMIADDLNLHIYPDFVQDLVYWGKNDDSIIRISSNRVAAFSKSKKDLELNNYFRRLLGKDELPEPIDNN